ncbi:hypothetical protein H9P43_000426 [Blastocladiella emersonii ATCC 22665]|nr:hypothetical protein H9P43_000426 [Blastocladiella emersonii ATCC 22665]
MPAVCRDTEKVEPSKSVNQMKESKERITYVKRKGVEDVSQVRTNAMQREQKRRNDEMQRAEILGHKAKKTQEAGDQLESQITDAWNKCMTMSNSLSTPHELHKMLVDQRKLCEALLNAKENLLVEYNAELKRKDDEYVKELKRQADEIDQLLQRMDQQYVAFKKSLRDELIQIERAFMEERGEMIDKNIKEIEALFQSRKDSEMRYLEERSKRIQDNGDALEELRVQDAEEYNLVKIKLETDVQVLEQQLQQMKATYQLNTEKLEYNYQVLKKRDDENSITINQQKRRITRMTDIVNNLKAKLAKQEKLFSSENSALQEDFNRISSQYQELTKKFKHFQVNDEVKFRELWEMNQENIKNLAAKVLMADSVIHQQQLGLPWEPPLMDALGTGATVEHAAATSSTPVPADGSTSGPLGASANGGPGLSGSGDEVPISMLLLSSKNSVVQSILGMLSTEASFLLDDKLTRLLAPLPAHERALLKLDTILKALDVGSASDLVLFLELFLQPKFHGSAPNLAAAVMYNQEEVDPPVVESMLIHPNQVTKVLMQYMRERERQAKHGAAAAGHHHASATGGADGSGEGGGSGKETRQLDRKESDAAKDGLKAHWNQIISMLDGSRFKNWETILQCMEAYHLLLSARHELTNEVADLETQNAELKHLLREYMSADVNKSLQIPPSQVILSHIQHQTQQKQQQQQQQKAHYAASPSPAPGGMVASKDQQS